MSRPLRILIVAAEMAPLNSTGGLAEVIAALPEALRKRGHDVRVAMPCYGHIPSAQRGEPCGMVVAPMGAHTEYGQLRQTETGASGVPLYLVEHNAYFGREFPYGTREQEYPDNAERFSFFCLALLDGIPKTGWMPDVVHCHDWHAAAMPLFLKSRYASDPNWRGVASVFTIHNIAFQGRYHADKLAATGLDPLLYDQGEIEFHGDMNLMKGALLLSDKISTVSQRYAQEIQTPEFGEGLDGILRARVKDLCGILNGVDYETWHPSRDPALPQAFDADHMDGKMVCKRALQDGFGLTHSDAPLFGMVSRLYWQKGVDLLAEAATMLENESWQLAVLGAGEAGLEARMLDLAARHPGRVGISLKYDADLSHLVQAGSDFVLMPSRYEPCGLGQMYGLAYGAVPVVRRTGGLADSVRDVNPVYELRGESNGISFVPKTSGALARAMQRALALYAEPKRYRAVQRRGMLQDFSWARSSEAYEALLQSAVNLQTSVAA